MIVPAPLLTTVRVFQLSGLSVVEVSTVIDLPGGAVMGRVSEPRDQRGVPKFSEPEAPAPMVVNVKDVIEPWLPPAEYWGLAFVTPMALMKPSVQLT